MNCPWCNHPWDCHWTPSWDGSDPDIGPGNPCVECDDGRREEEICEGLDPLDSASWLGLVGKKLKWKKKITL